jgi:hypothetical protein
LAAVGLEQVHRNSADDGFDTEIEELPPYEELGQGQDYRHTLPLETSRAAVDAMDKP